MRATHQPTDHAMSEHEAMNDLWAVYDRHYEEITQATRASLADHPELGSVLRATPPEELDEQSRISHELLDRAIRQGEWESYLAHIRAQGARYAQANLSFSAWFAATAELRAHLMPHLLRAHGKEPERLIAAARALDSFLERAMAAVGEAYLEAKEQTIVAQQQAILELSTPVLPLREGLLILPIIGVVDTHRARQLTEDLLRAIQAHRAKAVVMDVTGVATMDSRVANHLAQTVQAAGLMGTTVVVSGISSEVAQTLVALGADLSLLRTVGDLERGVDEADRLCGYRVVRVEDAAGTTGAG